jgi:hypothetical protein
MIAGLLNKSSFEALSPEGAAEGCDLLIFQINA